MEQQTAQNMSFMETDMEIKEDLVRILGYIASMCLFLLVLFGAIFTCCPWVAQDFTGIPGDFPHLDTINGILSFAVNSINSLATYLILSAVGIISFIGARNIDTASPSKGTVREKPPEPEQSKNGITIIKKEEISSPDKTEKSSKTPAPEESEVLQDPLPRDGTDIMTASDPEQDTPPAVDESKEPPALLLEEDPRNTALLLSKQEEDRIEFSDELAQEVSEMPDDSPEKHLVMAHSRKMKETCTHSQDENRCRVETSPATTETPEKKNKIREIRRRD